MSQRDQRASGDADVSGEPRLQPAEQAALSLHAPGIDSSEIIHRFEQLVLDLELAEDPVYVPASMRWANGGDDAGDDEGTVHIDVRRPDGALEGALRCRPRSEYAAHEIVVLAAHTGVALGAIAGLREIEQRESRIRRVSEHLQDALLPPLPELPHTMVSVAYRAAGREAKVGGDFYDVFPLPDGNVMIVVGDVVGKGVEAAARTSCITQTLRALGLQRLPLDTLLELADQQVTWQDPDIMATLWCGLYVPASGELEFASLGHPPAMLVRSHGDAIRLELEGLPLGLRDLTSDEPEVRRRKLESRDLLVLYTDGVVEASRDFLAGQESLLRAIVARQQEPVEEILQAALDEMLADAGHHDDAVMLMLRRR